MCRLRGVDFFSADPSLLKSTDCMRPAAMEVPTCKRSPQRVLTSLRQHYRTTITSMTIIANIAMSTIISSLITTSLRTIITMI